MTIRRSPTNFAILGATLLSPILYAAQSQQTEADPKLTEVWEPVPRVVTPGVGTAAPSDAIVLFNGRDLSEWQQADGSPAKWKIAGNTFTVVKSGNIQTKRSFGDCQLHIEWRTPAKVEGEGQERGNSGVFLQGHYEVQILDSYNNRTFSNGQAASIYKQHIPMVNASRKPGEWQSYDIFFRAPRRAENGTVLTPAYFTVVHNGVLVQDHVEVRGTTFNNGPPFYQKHNPKEPLVLQDHGFPVSFRNIWIRELQNPLGIFDAQTDIGRVRNSGSATYDPQLQSYAIAGSGQNMWGDHDDFHFVWKRMTGNFILSTRTRFISKGVEAHRKVGWTVRPTLDASSPHVTAALHGDGLASLQFRRTTGGTTEEAKSRDSLANADAVIQLERRDGVYIMSVARFGDTLVTHEVADVSLPDTVYVGLFVCAHNDTVVEQAAFSNVRITTPAKRDLVPYRDYIGSNLEILDVATGNATIVHSYRGSFQAPNWTHDGKALIYAQEGRLYRFDLSRRAADVINTDFATRNNNDHVLSFDGRMLAISHHAVEDSGASIVYTVPATGGTPKRVTAKGPSYLHGWSPDGRWLVYTGQRSGDYDIYKIPSSGGSEIRLTSTQGLDDGPEYSPDGKYIYFNSVRSGRMQIWRMRPDGSGQQQITNDGVNNWFPHISPDGKWIVYIAFPPEVPANDHPFYKHVLLKLMPVGGGPSRVIAYVYGGQGTINVPSWSPDGTRLAFVSNTTIP